MTTRVLLVLAIAGCHAAAAGGPAWPKSAGTVTPDDYQDDGGESLAPHPSHVAAIEVATDDTPAASATPAPTATATAIDRGTPTTPSQPPVPPTETIEIQIEDIQVGPGDIIITP